MRLAIQLDEADIRKLIEADNNCFSEGMSGIPEWLLALFQITVPEIPFDRYKKYVKAATKEHRLSSFEFDREADLRYPGDQADTVPRRAKAAGR